MVYRIRDWASVFENNRSREIKNPTWVPIPNRFDGASYAELVDHPEGPAHYAVFVGCALIASRCDPRGTLLRGGGEPHSDVSLARILRFPPSVVGAALSRLTQVGWIQQVTENGEPIPQEGAGIPQEGAPRTEQKGREQNRREGNLTRRGRRVELSTDALDVAAYLRDAILSHDPEHRCARNGAHEKWAVQIDRAIRIDKRTPDQLRAIIDFAHRREENTFWRPNLQSGQKLRDQFDTIKAQAARLYTKARVRPQNRAAMEQFLAMEDSE